MVIYKIVRSQSDGNYVDEVLVVAKNDDEAKVRTSDFITDDAHHYQGCLLSVKPEQVKHGAIFSMNWGNINSHYYWKVLTEFEIVDALENMKPLKRAFPNDVLTFPREKN